MADSMTVNGTGSVSVQPDCVNVSLGVSMRADTVCGAQQSVNAVISAVREAVIEGGVNPADIRVSSVSVYPEYDYYSGSGENVIGYNASHQLDVVIRDVETAGGVIDAALSAGANSIYGLNFFVSNEEEYYEQALAAALASAADKAQFLAESTGVGLGRIVSITENTDYIYDSGSALAAKTEDAEIPAATELEAGTCTVTASVRVEYEIR